ncbi:MAG TPA: hypothetical protein VGQ90_02780 [Stellaceae bacterium]|jgi:hypothetical protein|nr:hypothetical protein [Stellaceae bacterium]
MTFGLEKFKGSRLGRRIAAVIEDPQRINDMIVFSRHGMPAVQAIGKNLLEIGPEVRDDQVKKTIGRWVREVLEQHGWTVAKKRRVAPGNLFSTGMVYRAKATQPSATMPPENKAPQMSAAERAAAWLDGIKDLPHTKPLSDEAISRDSIYADRDQG